MQEWAELELQLLRLFARPGASPRCDCTPRCVFFLSSGAHEAQDSAGAKDAGPDASVAATRSATPAVMARSPPRISSSSARSAVALGFGRGPEGGFLSLIHI